MQRLVADLFEQLRSLQRDAGLIGNPRQRLAEPGVERAVAFLLARPPGDEHSDRAIARDDRRHERALQPGGAQEPAAARPGGLAVDAPGGGVPEHLGKLGIVDDPQPHRTCSSRAPHPSVGGAKRERGGGRIG